MASLASGPGLAATLAGLSFEAAEDSAAFLQGVPEGEELIGHLSAMRTCGGGKQSRNAAFAPSQLARARKEIIPIDPDVEVAVIAPAQNELDKLREKWAAATTSTAALQAVLGTGADDSIANLSSIVMLATIQGKKILLTGDGLESKIIQGWREFKGKPNGALDPTPIDIMKVPHHGSDRNNSIELFNLFPADHYVFCANGKDDNPDMKTLVGLFKARAGASFTIHLTYAEDHPKTKRQTKFLKDQRDASGGKVKVVFGTPGGSIRIPLA